jgi:hypothetical protein
MSGTDEKVIYLCHSSHCGGACPLTRDAHSPGGAFCTNTALVEVAKFESW